jgi:hypothetical protein
MCQSQWQRPHGLTRPSTKSGVASLGHDSVPGGRCLVAWSKVARPVELGGLGVLDLTTFGYGLRMRWEWLARTEPDRMWACIPNKSERIVCAMFDVSTTVVVGSGTKTLFWENRWVDGLSITSRAPLLVQAVNKKVQKIQIGFRGHGRRSLDC